VARPEFDVPGFTGNYIEPFLGGGAVFFHLGPSRALLSDANSRLIETYEAIRSDWSGVVEELTIHQKNHAASYYYEERSRNYSEPVRRAAQFIYLNRTCWNGLYRENLKGEFNVPIGTKTNIISDDDDFAEVARRLDCVDLRCCDFEETISRADDGDFIFVDPPYTTAHNFNGFVKYNQNIFSWEDQVRLSRSVREAAERGCRILLTNAAHESVRELYDGWADVGEVARSSVISGSINGRKGTKEQIIRIGFSLNG
jgi:DNA adenine methylase